MSDLNLSKRLRDMAGLQRKMDRLAGFPGQSSKASSKLLEEAADYIERLQKLIRVLNE